MKSVENIASGMFVKVAVVLHGVNRKNPIRKSLPICPDAMIMDTTKSYLEHVSNIRPYIYCTL